MTKEKYLEAIENLRQYFKKKEIPKIDYPHNEFIDPCFPDICLVHCHGMLDKMLEFLEQGRIDKVNRWLGFIQGVLWRSGLFTLDDLKNMNKPD
ncbi:hypothetical protein A2V71_00510 [Candidatus Berkelbacteria bacterium RBG_13_40_8]|uniref:Uncharacterized protein n=1 Tax=Candidatus Berkelbacteria bacterium RBG_13_40_8 TaxID=1797467 RepID=A0A1F5DQ95_9BACT|nr:MAG: hypothetical protein A2V71_00510 [Candidatus Berkelbacteria bacterium RBG_13_40_8]